MPFGASVFLVTRIISRKVWLVIEPSIKPQRKPKPHLEELMRHLTVMVRENSFLNMV